MPIVNADVTEALKLLWMQILESVGVEKVLILLRKGVKLVVKQYMAAKPAYLARQFLRLN
jgi:hypothetical protein